MSLCCPPTHTAFSPLPTRGPLPRRTHGCLFHVCWQNAARGEGYLETTWECAGGEASCAASGAALCPLPWTLLFPYPVLLLHPGMRDMEQRGGGSGRSIIPGLMGWDRSSSVHVYTCECMCRYVMGCLGPQPPPSELCLSASTTAQDPTPASVPTLCKDVGDCISAGALPGRVGHEHLSELVLLGFPIGSRFPAAFSP